MLGLRWVTGVWPGHPVSKGFNFTLLSLISCHLKLELMRVLFCGSQGGNTENLHLSVFAALVKWLLCLLRAGSATTDWLLVLSQVLS